MDQDSGGRSNQRSSEQSDRGEPKDQHAGQSSHGSRASGDASHIPYSSQETYNDSQLDANNWLLANGYMGTDNQYGFQVPLWSTTSHEGYRGAGQNSSGAQSLIFGLDTGVNYGYSQFNSAPILGPYSTAIQESNTGTSSYMMPPYYQNQGNGSLFCNPSFLQSTRSASNRPYPSSNQYRGASNYPDVNASGHHEGNNTTKTGQTEYGSSYLNIKTEPMEPEPETSGKRAAGQKRQSSSSSSHPEETGESHQKRKRTKSSKKLYTHTEAEIIVSVFEEFSLRVSEALSLKTLEKSAQVRLEKDEKDMHKLHRDYLTSCSELESDNHKERISSLRNYVTKSGNRLNKIFAKYHLDEVCIDAEIFATKSKSKTGKSGKMTNKTTKNEEKGIGQRTHKLTFKMVLSTAITDQFKGLDSQPVVEIRYNSVHQSWLCNLATMEKGDDGVWTGSCEMKASTRRLEYKYFIHDGVHKPTDKAYEWLGQQRYGGVINRWLDISNLNEDTVVYDGLVRWQDQSGVIEKITRSVKNFVGASTATNKEEKAQGMLAMMPDWERALMKGKTVEELCLQIISVKRRQLECLSGFAYNISYDAKQMVDEVFSTYVNRILTAHTQMVDSGSDSHIIISSLIGLLHIACMTPMCSVERCFAKKYISVVAKCVNETMEKITARLSGTSTLDQQLVISSLTSGTDEKFISEVLGRIKYTISAVQNDHKARGSWLWLIPVIHILDKSDGRKASCSIYNDKLWWGTRLLEDYIHKEHWKTYPHTEDWKVYLQMLSPFSKTMNVMRYTFLAILTADQLSDMLKCTDVELTLQLPTSAVIACVRFHVPRYTHYDSCKKKELLIRLVQYVQRQNTSNSIQSDEQCLTIAGATLHRVQPSRGYYYDSDCIENCRAVAHTLLLLLDDFIKRNRDANLRELGGPALVFLNAFISSREKLDIKEEELKQWRSLFVCVKEDQTISEWWLRSCETALKSRLEKVVSLKRTDSVINLYCTNNFDIPSMDNTVAEVAFSIAEKLLDGNTTNLLKLPAKVGTLVDKALSKAWKMEDETQMSIVKNMVKWGNFLSVWRFYQKINDEQKRCISEKNQVRMALSTSALEYVLENLEKATITFRDYTYLSEHSETVLLLCEVSDKLKDEVIAKALKARGEEIETFHEFHKLLRNLWSSCNTAVKDPKALQQWLKRDMQSLVFRETVVYNGTSNTVLCELVSEEVRQILEVFYRLNKRRIFHMEFEKNVRRASPGSLLDVVQLHETALQKYQSDIDRLTNGSITIEQTARLRSRYFQDRQEDFLNELREMLPPTVSRERIQQIKLCSELEQYRRGAEVMLKLKDQFKLSGDFTDMLKIRDSANQQLPLNDLNLQLLESAKSIRDITDRQRECLETFVECSDLVAWFRKEVQKRDISNFVDLASSTLGEDDHAALKTRYLLNALTGYSPLIHDLDTEGTNYESFKEMCEKVWAAMKTNPDLMKSLEACSLELEWLKKVKTHFGNVEMKSITQANAINKTGVYQVSNIKDFKELDDILSLTCEITDNDRTEEKSYSYSDLKDLQSKLTLVAGEQQIENKGTIQQFDMMRDAVENLAQSYMDLRREGCIQFDDMSVIVYCDPDSDISIKVKMSADHDGMCGHNSESKNAMSHCQDLHVYMTRCLQEWKNFMEQKRNEHQELNYFTTEQLVVLRRELGTFLSEKTESSLNQTQPLLSMIQSVQAAQLMTLLASYKPDQGGESSSQMEITDNTMEVLPQGSTLVEKLEKIWNTFIEHTSSEKSSVKNFLGISHLGNLLRQLKDMKKVSNVERKIPSWLSRGRPCLVASQQAEVYKTVLTIYEYDPDYTFPSRNEVLICSTHTRVEEVKLFISRALNDPVSFYCMVNCHLLDYAICRYIDNRLSSTADDKITTYGLAFIYNIEEKSSRIKMYLEKYLVKNVETARVDILSTYVRKILAAPDSLASAATVDPDRYVARLIRSSRAGVGKSLKQQHLCNQLREENRQLIGKDITLPVYKTIDTDRIIARLTKEFGNGYTDAPYHTIHIDIAHEVETGVDELLFNLIILRSLVNSEGVVWQAQPSQYYIIECMPHTKRDKSCAHEVMDYIPSIKCVTPQEALEVYASGNIPAGFNGFDETILNEEQWQIVLKYLDCKERGDRLYNKSIQPFTDKQAALKLLTSNCGLRNPTWSELRHYVYFLSDQLTKVDLSSFCSPVVAEDLPGFRSFVFDFMFQMAKDFATRSLRIAEETPHLNFSEIDAEHSGNGLEQLEMKRTWESGNHPYLFFNEDGATFTPLGFYVNNTGGPALSLVDCQTKEVLIPNCMPNNLKGALDRQNLPMSENFNDLNPANKLRKLRSVMVKEQYQNDQDPDPNYVLTMDNAKKILAIHQRLRVDIPVIIMGETGCGKTKLIEFMSKLQVPDGLKLETMITVKIHGGTTEEDIIKRVLAAQQLALENQQKCKNYAAERDFAEAPTIYTVLFLDEANTTEAIGLVKEILCDHRIRGDKLRLDTGLKIIAACNPYRRHSQEMIDKLKKAGLGYNVSEDHTVDRFGHIPMRHLVYRVQALSQSLLPLVWDFGTLKSKTDRGVDVECAYIIQMIKKANESNRQIRGSLDFGSHTKSVAEILSATQTFMRKQKDECSFVSLRDIQRLLDVANWFYRQRKALYHLMDQIKLGDEDEDEEEEETTYPGQRDHATRSLVLALGVCYLARLEEGTRKKYAKCVGDQLTELIGDEELDGANFLFEQIELCQDLFIREVIDKDSHRNIAMNKALKENVFMMIICIENRIPLFLVGKPGSSKSLSKSMVIDAMKGNSSKKQLFKDMKRTYMVSFQCSRHATPAGIIEIFEHCANFQKGQDLDKFVSVVVLDEVGLAEDSENMPLKTLHPLLEDGCEGNKTPEPWMKCSFVGISNWALDPAKMNRGIFVQRGTPNPSELTDIAKEICSSSQDADSAVRPYIDHLAAGYLDMCSAQKPEERDLTEFFGLRDFYSLMKMVVNFAAKNGELNRNQLEHSIRRNFGGFNPDTGFDPMVIFSKHCQTLDQMKMQTDGRPPIDSIGLIESSLSGENTAIPGMESRYLLILTESLSVLSVILDKFSSHERQPEVVFGSKFRHDVSYTQVCRNIYRIKTCMAIGKPVILLNLDDLYESLYDALNQYFSTWGDRKFVDLGLGTHRVKTFVDDKFRLVVIADKSKVYSQFPIPLINRLEKHYVSATSLLSEEQKLVKHQLEDWAKKFVTPLRLYQNMCPENCDRCGAVLERPYPLPCRRHYVGPCCQERILRGIAEGVTQACTVEGCDTEIDADYIADWTEEISSLQNRQYFENTTQEMAFIGYSTEATALAVGRATKDIQNQANADSDMGDESERFWQQVLERAQYYMLLCSTAESVMRLHKTELHTEADKLMTIYLQQQQHDNLLLYLKQELSELELLSQQEPQSQQELPSEQDLQSELARKRSLFIQVTTFAELMGGVDVEALSKSLNFHTSSGISVHNVYLKDFNKEDQFTDSIRSVYASQIKGIESKLLLVQCESADENSELLDSVRFIIQRESEGAKGTTHTVLLLNLPRGRQFSGYQGGKWRCVHIDDPRLPELTLPSLRNCTTRAPSDIIGQLLMADDPEASKDDAMDVEAGDSPKSEITSDVEMGDSDDDDDMPPLEDEDEEYKPPVIVIYDDDEYPDTEMDPEPCQIKESNQMEITPSQPDVERPIRQRPEVERPIKRSDILQFVIQCLPSALSIICKSDQASGGMNSPADKFSILRQLLTYNEGFRRIFLRHVRDLMKKKEEDALMDWVKTDAAKASNMKQSETMRHAIEDALERAIVPALAAVISFIDSPGNIPLLDDQSHIWLQIFDKCHMLGLELDPKTKTFKMQAYDGSRNLTTKLPFSFLAKANIDTLISAAGHGIGFEELTETVYGQFKAHSPIGQVLYGEDTELDTAQLLQSYTEDFVSITHPCNSPTEHKIVTKALLSHIEERASLQAHIIYVHTAYEQLKNVFSNLSLIFAINWKKKDQKKFTSLIESKMLEPEYKPTSCDLAVLQCLLDYLASVTTYKITSDPEEWAEKVESCRYIIHSILPADHQPDENQDDTAQSCREKWRKLLLKKLYVEHIIIPSTPDPVSGKRQNFKLADFIKVVKGVDFSEDETFSQVCNWLTKAVTDGIQKLYPECPELCPVCNEKLDAPVRLPCRHILCDSCVKEVTFCPDGACAKMVPDKHPSSTTDNHDPKDLEEFKSFRTRLNKFFMAFVSEVVFDGDSDPDDDIIIWLLDCITFKGGTKEFSLYNTVDVVDPTPVVRSFLLKLLLQCTRTDTVKQHLGGILTNWSDKKNLKIQTMSLIIDCKKDLLTTTMALEDLEFYLPSPSNKPSVEDLFDLAELQYNLSLALQSLDLASHEQMTRKQIALETKLKYFIATESSNPQLGYYVVRQLLATQGESFLKDLCRSRHSYLLPEDIQRSLDSYTVPDILAVYGGETLSDLCTAIDQFITLGGTEEGVQGIIEKLTQAQPTQPEWLLMEALFSQVTRTLAHSTPVSPDLRTSLMEGLMGHLTPRHKEVLRILTGEELPSPMDIKSSRGVNLTMLILNMLDCMCTGHDTADLTPLSELITNPSEASKHYLPTMIDNQIEVYATQITAAIGGNNPTIYLCTNDHPYVVDRCGRTDEELICNDCGVKIGGLNHELLPGNRPIDLTDKRYKTEVGHILGSANQRTGPTAERKLSSLSCSVIRCLTHMSMFAGALFDPDKVGAMIKRDDVPGDQVLPYLSAHIEADIEDLSLCCVENRDDCILLLHELIHLMKQGSQGDPVILTSIEQRETWEAKFAQKFVKPAFLTNKVDILDKIREKLNTAQSNNLRRILFTSTSAADTENILATSGLWTYRTKLTIQAVQNTITTLPEVYPTLKAMVNNIAKMVSVKHIPDVLELFKVFSDRFHSRFSRKQSADMQISNFCEEYETEVPNIRKLVKSYIAAWNNMAQFITEGQTPYEQLDMNASMSTLLLDKFSGRIKNQLNFIRELIDTHNATIQQEAQSVRLTAVRSSHVVSLQNDDELLGVILSQRKYAVRENSADIDYDWTAIERELVLRYRNNKPRIEFSVKKLQYYVYSEDFNLHSQMEAIDDWQESLHPELQTFIESRLSNQVPVLTFYLKDVTVAINFLHNLKREGDFPLTEYMTPYAKDISYLSSSIQLKHVRDVWLLLKYTQTDLLMKRNQEPFDAVSPDLSSELQEQLDGCCVYNSPRTKLLLQELFKFITLQLNKDATTQRHAIPKVLNAALREFIEYRQYKSDADLYRAEEILRDLPVLPDQLTVRQAPKAWTHIWARYTKPKTSDQL